MKIYIKEYYKETLLWFFLALGLVFIYWPIIIGKNNVERDTDLLIIPLKSIHSITDYVKAFKNNKIVDIQPIRDLSLKLDLILNDWFNVETHIFINIIIWLLCCYCVFRIFYFVSDNKILSKIFIIFYAFYPTFTQTVSWPVARKHLLSYFFILAATFYFIIWVNDLEKRWKYLFISTVLYFFSLLSQPITLLWPVWCLIYLSLISIHKLRWSYIAVRFLPLIIIMLGAAIANYYYYTNIYISIGGVSKFASSDFLGLKILSIGRSFVQLFLPIFFAASYFKGSWLNIIGIPLLVLFLFISYKFIGIKKTIVWAILGGIAPFIVLGRMTNVFLSDTYLLLPSLSYFLIILLIVNPLDLKKHFKIVVVSSLTIFSFLVIKSKLEVNLWTSSKKFWQVSYQREPSCINMINYGLILFTEGDIDKGLIISKKIIKNKCVIMAKNTSFNLGQLKIFALNLLYSKEISFEQKLKLLAPFEKASVYISLIIAAIYLQDNQIDKALILASEIFRDPNVKLNNTSKDPVIKIFSSYCQNNTSNECRIINNRIR